MSKTTRSKGKKTEKWTSGSEFIFKSSPGNKGVKTDRRLTMTPKKNLSSEGMKGRRKSMMLKRLHTSTADVLPTEIRRTRRQSMVHLNNNSKKIIARATSEKVLSKNKTTARTPKISPIIEKEVKTKSKAAGRNTTRSLMTKRQSMDKLTIVVPEEKLAATKSKKPTKEKVAPKQLAVIKKKTSTPKKGKSQPRSVKKSPAKPTSKSITKTPEPAPARKAGRRSGSAKKPAAKKLPATPTAVEVQLALADAINGSAKGKVKRLGGRSPLAVTRSLRSCRKVQIIMESPPRTGKYRKTPAARASTDGGSPILSVRRRNLKPFTPRPDNPYDILKSNMRKRITSRIDMMDVSPERGPNSPSFLSFANTPSSSSNLPPTPTSSKRPRLSRDSFERGDRKLLRGFRKLEERPLSSTPIKGSASGNNSTFLSINESMNSTNELSCLDGPSSPPDVKTDAKTKKGYCSVM